MYQLLLAWLSEPESRPVQPIQGQVHLDKTHSGIHDKEIDNVKVSVIKDTLLSIGRKSSPALTTFLACCLGLGSMGESGLAKP
jgi:hypothetical protein